MLNSPAIVWAGSATIMSVVASLLRLAQFYMSIMCEYGGGVSCGMIWRYIWFLMVLTPVKQVTILKWCA